MSTVVALETAELTPPEVVALWDAIPDVEGSPRTVEQVLGFAAFARSPEYLAVGRMLLAERWRRWGRFSEGETVRAFTAAKAARIVIEVSRVGQDAIRRAYLAGADGVASFDFRGVLTCVSVFPPQELPAHLEAQMAGLSSTDRVVIRVSSTDESAVLGWTEEHGVEFDEADQREDLSVAAAEAPLWLVDRVMIAMGCLLGSADGEAA